MIFVIRLKRKKNSAFEIAVKQKLSAHLSMADNLNEKVY